MRPDKIVFGVAVMAAVLLSWQNFQKLWDDWMTLPAYSHGVLVPFVFALLIYLERDRLRNLNDIPSLWGVFLIGAGVLSLALGTVSGLYFIQQVSLLFLVSGIIAGYWGLRTLNATRFPILYLLFMIPLPYLVFNAIALPLQMMAAKGSAHLLEMLQIPVYREGNIINLPHISLGVVKACSGIQSLVSLLAIAVLLAKIGNLKTFPATLFILSAVPIAVVANMIRIAGAGVLGSMNPDLAEGFFHMFSGWVIFLFAFLSMVFEIRLLQRFRRAPDVA
jgi:exosortase|uniref:Exosortase n=1 Tax=Leptospirillum ferriphilum TaxID=178606 RepID=A0A7C3LUZ8_9BACT